MPDSIDWERIFAESETVLEKNPTDCNASRRRAQAIGGQGKISNALDLMESHLTQHPNDVKAWDLRCAYLIDQGKYIEAVKSSTRSLKLDPDFKIGYYNRACAYALSDNDSAALADLEEVIKFDIEFCAMAKDDIHFQKLYKNSRFIELVNKSEHTG